MNPTEMFNQLVERARRATWWQLVLVGVAAAFVLPLVVSIVASAASVVIPMALVAAMVWALVMSSRAWIREFAYLMRLDDDVFPGRNDKLIWAMMLMFLPPLGAWLFKAYREIHWPEAKPKPGRAEAFDVP